MALHFGKENVLNNNYKEKNGDTQENKLYNKANFIDRLVGH